HYYALLEYNDMEFQASYDSWRVLVHPEDLDRVEGDLRLAINSGNSFNFDVRMKLKSDKWRWFSIRGRVVRWDHERKALRMVGTLSDITARKADEDQIRLLNATLEQRVRDRTAELESSHKELADLCYSVAHDLRAPMRHIDGYVNLVRTRCGSGLSDQGFHYLDTIANSACQMGLLVDSLLQFSRSGRTELRMERMNMNQALQDALLPLKEIHAERRIEWVIGDLPSVRGDYVLICQVWANLLENAVKYTRIREAARIEVGCRQENREFIFMTKDNGVGFDMQYAEKLFRLFHRLHPIEEFEGIGLGLALVHRIINRHGGRVWYEAALNQGATFYFSLPTPAVAEVRNG
ncbi:MAG: ATP-binding protein, partial [bacterium]